MEKSRAKKSGRRTPRILESSRARKGWEKDTRNPGERWDQGKVRKAH